jgi:TonB-dependent starch-binding outer membrane protein SusC
MRRSDKKLPVFNNGISRALILALFALIFGNVAVLGQTHPVTGKIVANENGGSLAGVTVKVKGSNASAITAADGSFTINAAPNATLIISSVGYSSQEIPLRNLSTVSISLVADAQGLQQVVVVGYGTVKRKDLNGSVSSITADQIAKTPITSVDQALQGRAAGVQVINNDGSPGGNISVLIRGIGSLAGGGNQPLYIVDGYPIQGGINNINPNEIASIDVLKDAATTAIYGIRAGNGVVIITTKHGLKGRTQVSLDAYEGFQGKPKEYKLLNAQQFATLSNYVEATDSTHTYHGVPIWHTPNQLHSVDWQNALYRPGLTQSYSVAIRGGSDKVQTAATFGYYDQKGIVLGSFFKRFTAGFNMDFQAAKWLKASTNIRYSYIDNNTPFGTGSLFQLAVNPPTLDSGNRLTNQISDGKGNYGFFNPQNSNVFKFNNPVYGINTQQSKNISQNVLATSSLEATLIEGLRVKTNAGITFNNYSGSFFSPEDDRANQQYPGSIVGIANYHQSMNTNFEWLWENTIAYDKTFGKHSISFVGGVSAQKDNFTAMGAGGIPPNSTIRDLAQVSNLIFDAGGNGKTIHTLESQFARLTYQFADRYILSGVIRRDGSSNFAEGHQYGTFPSGGLTWKAKNESFLENVDWLDDLKFRGSYGLLGNQSSIGPFKYQALYAGNYAANFNGNNNDNLGYPFNKVYQNGIAQTQPANPNLKWETDYQTDIGTDMAFLHGALSLTADWYNRRSKDFLLNILVSNQTGYSSETENVGSMTNKGLELALTYHGNKGGAFQYNLGLTWATNKNTLTSITSGTLSLQNASGSNDVNLSGQGWNIYSNSLVGGPVGEFWGYKTLGIFQTQAQITALNAKAPGGSYYRAATSPGDRYFADINKDGVVNANDLTSIGNPQPKFYGGLNFDGSFKNWDFNLYFYGTYGNKIMNYVESDLESFQKRGSEGVENVSQQYYQNYWTPSRPSNRYSRPLAVDDNTLNAVPSSTWVENGSYLKLKNFAIGYTLPTALTNRFAISKLRVYVSSQNLFTITKYSGLDPEIGIRNGNATENGVDDGTYPSSRFFTAGINVTF